LLLSPAPQVLSAARELSSSLPARAYDGQPF
jgi:hypothetical protein